MRRISYLAPLVGLVALTACETIQGAGRDMQTAGQMITQQGYSNSPQSYQGTQQQPAVSDPFATGGGF